MAQKVDVMIDVLHLFPKLDTALINLLSELDQHQWNKDTLCRKWKVKDIAAHLLDGALRRLSAGRDSYLLPAPEFGNYRDLVEYLNTLNADWIQASKRLSPQIITEQLRQAQDQLFGYFSSLDPDAKAIFPVAWAGEHSSSNRFDIAREYTERWHHQQQIRHAVGAESILTKQLYHPFLEICMQALPYHYRNVEVSDGTLIRIEVVGESGGVWSIQQNLGVWSFSDSSAQADTMVFIDENIAWMLFANNIDAGEASQFWQVLGNRELGIHVLSMRTFMV